MTLQHRLDRSVAQIADPASDTRAKRLTFDEGAIADALHAAADGYVESALF